jgi:hypothetical protein
MSEVTADTPPVVITHIASGGQPDESSLPKSKPLPKPNQVKVNGQSMDGYLAQAATNLMGAGDAKLFLESMDQFQKLEQEIFKLKDAQKSILDKLRQSGISKMAFREVARDIRMTPDQYQAKMEVRQQADMMRKVSNLTLPGLDDVLKSGSTLEDISAAAEENQDLVLGSVAALKAKNNKNKKLN